MKSIIFIFVFIFFGTTYGFEAKITQARGEVTVDDSRIEVGALVSVGQIIEGKSKNSFFVVEYSNGTKFMIKQAKLKILKLEKDESIIDLISGTIFTKVQKKSNINNFQIKTRTASLGVRGTMFFVTQENESTYLCVCHGTVEAQNLSGKGIFVHQNEDIHIKEDGALKKTPATTQMIQMGEEIFKTF